MLILEQVWSSSEQLRDRRWRWLHRDTSASCPIDTKEQAKKYENCIYTEQSILIKIQGAPNYNIKLQFNDSGPPDDIISKH